MRTLAFVGIFLVASWAIGTFSFQFREDLDAAELEPWQGGDFIELPSGRTHYVDIGPATAPTILFFHGSGRGVADWQDGLFSEFSDQYRLIGFDYFGNGLSDRGFGLRYGYNLWARQAIELLDQLDVGKAVFVGHSVGGVIASITAADYPQRSAGVVTIGTGTAMDPAQILPFIPGVGELTYALNPSLSEVFSERHAEFIKQAERIKGTHWAFLVYVRRQYTIDGLRVIRGLYKDVPVPLMHISGTEDRSIPHRAARALSEESGGRFVPVTGAGHNVHIDAPQRLAEIIEMFVSELADASGPSGS